MNKFFYWMCLFMCLLLVACEKSENGTSDDETSGEPSPMVSLKDALKELQDNATFKIWLCSHRGNTANGIADFVPENSLEAIRQAVSAKADMIEIDVRMTSDGVLVLMHDKDIERTTTGSGAVSALTYEELKKIRLKSGSHVSDETLPTLQEALLAGKGQIYFNLDIANKDIPAHKIVALLEETGMTGQVLLYTSTDRNYAVDLKKENAGLLLHPMVKNMEDIAFYTSRMADVYVMQVSISDAVEGILPKAIREKGLLAFSNVVGRNDENMLKGNYSGIVSMINKRIALIQTDYVEKTNEYLVSKGYR